MALSELKFVLAVDGAGNVTGALKDVEETAKRLSTSTKTATGEMEKGWQAIINQLDKFKGAILSAAAAFSAFELMKTAADATMFAANVEQANRALSVIANTMGMTSGEALKYRDGLRDLNITTNSATSATAQFIKAGFPLSSLNKLGTAAQGAAISYGMMTGEMISSSQALDKMIRSLVTGNVTELHTLGINVMMRDTLREKTKQTGEASMSVDSHSRKLLMLNDVLKQTEPLMNLYAASTDLAAKQISSSKRPIEELKLALGTLFLPELTEAATAFYKTVSDAMKQFRTGEGKQALASWKNNILETFYIIKAEIMRIAMLMDKLGGSITSAGMLLFAPGKAMGNKNSSEQFDKMAAGNMKYEERYNAGDTELQRMADKLAAGTSEKPYQDNPAWIADGLRKKAELEEKARQEKIEAEIEANRKVIADRDKAVTHAWNKQQDHLNETAYWLNAHDKALQKINSTYDNQIAAIEKTDPAYKKQLATLDLMKKQNIDRLNEEKEAKRIMESEGQADNADNWSLKYDAAAKSMDSFFKDYNQAQALTLEMELTNVNASEKFYRISTGNAATQRIGILSKSVELLKQQYDLQNDTTDPAGLARLQIAAKIRSENEKILEQQKQIYDATPIGGMTNAIQEYGKAADNIGQQIHDVFANAFKGMEDALVSFVQTGKFSLTSLFKQIQADIIRMAIAKPITAAISSGISAAANYVTNTDTQNNTNKAAESGSSTGNLFVAVVAAVGAKILTAHFASNKAFDNYMNGWIKQNQEFQTSLLNRIAKLNTDKASQQALARSTMQTAQAKELADYQASYMAAIRASMTGAGLSNFAATDLGTNLSKIISLYEGQQAWNLSTRDRNSPNFAKDNYGLNGNFTRAYTLAKEYMTSSTNLVETQKKEYDNLVKVQNLANASAARGLNMRLMELQSLDKSAEYLQLVNEAREVEMMDMLESEKVIQRQINVQLDLKAATEASSAALSKTVDIAISAANAIKDIQGGSLSVDSPEEKYRKAMLAFTTNTDNSKAGELGKSFLTASQGYNASGAGYQSDYASVMAKLQGIAGMTAVTTAEKQLTVLESIRDLLAANNYSAADSAYSSLPKFASGGITNGISIAGEGRYREAIIPLPDGRNVPVQLTGSADNKELVEEVRQLRRQVAALLNVTQAVGTRVVEATEKTAKSTGGIEQKAKLQAAA